MKDHDRRNEIINYWLADYSYNELKMYFYDKEYERLKEELTSEELMELYIKTLKAQGATDEKDS